MTAQKFKTTPKEVALVVPGAQKVDLPKSGLPIFFFSCQYILHVEKKKTKKTKFNAEVASKVIQIRSAGRSSKECESEKEETRRERSREGRERSSS